jgi:vesicle-associated membrane protein 7
VHYISLSSSDYPDSDAAGLAFLCVSKVELGRRVPFAFLVDIQKNFLDTYSPDTPFSTLPAYGAAAFNSTLKARMAAMASPETQQDAIRKAQSEIDDARAVMSENIERVLERGERIDLLVDKTDRLGGNARDFRVRSTGLRRRMWWKNVKLMALLILVGIMLLYLLVGMGCGLPAWGRCIRR